ncbi:MAG: Fe-S metabolism protein SufE [Flavobacteriales bacterium]|nr:Fe-S metabolism protein SufE [Flavobacteriales bacterium]
MSNEINEIQDEIIEEFEMFDDWMQKYELIIDLGKDLSGLDEKEKVEANIIKGCQSKVWLSAKMTNGKIVFTADSDAIMTKGIIALLIRALSGQDPKKIARSNLYFIDKIGLKNHLSITRSNGLEAMIKKMKIYAIALNK